ncbi:MAG: ABC transporter ATP-binding protein [Erysipelotrichaceae bacterium]
MLKIKNLKKAYGNHEVIKGIDLEVKPGEIIGFIGMNGSGKTTTIKAIVGIHSFDGEIYINGKSIKDDEINAKMDMAYVADNPDIYDTLKAIDYLNLMGDIYEVPVDIRKKEIEELTKDLDIYNNLNDEIRSFSHGMKQKLVLTAAFMHHPKLLVLDEPFVGLDPKASYLLKEKMRKLCDEGSAVFFSTHVLEVAEKLCDRIIILKDGKIFYDGSFETIHKTHATLEELFMELANE